MHSALAPTLKKRLGDFFVLWFKASNTYSVVDTTFKEGLENYIKAEHIDAFEKSLSGQTSDKVTQIAKQFEHYLKACNITVSDIPDIEQSCFDSSLRSISATYLISKQHIKINYCTNLVKNTIHPSIAHFETHESQNSLTEFDIYLRNDWLHLFKNKQLLFKVAKRDYHLLQGEFKMALFNCIYTTEEKDWIATVHGSSISNGETAILFIGKSGSGKSTLTALLAAHGFDLLTDDISPLAKKDLKIYHNPSGISIKEGALPILDPFIPELGSIPEVIFNPNKGALKYLPCQPPEKSQYPCKAIVLVDYKPNSELMLSSLSIKEALQIVLPDSWINPNKNHAKAFLDWLATLEYYKLTYSKTQGAIDAIGQIFKS